MLIAGAGMSAAQADGMADLQARLDAALKGAKSFVVTTLYPAQAYSSTLMVVAPDRTRLAVAVSANTTDIVTIGQTEYSSKNGATFEKRPAAPSAGPPRQSPGSVKVMGMRPDVRVGSKTYGAFDASVPLGVQVTLTCTYDKKNYRLVRCANDEITQRYGKYDDPSNVVDAPKNAVDAPAVDAKQVK